MIRQILPHRTLVDPKAPLAGWPQFWITHPHAVQRDSVRAFQFGVRIVRLYQRLVDRNGAARVLASQLLRSGTSIGANLEEAAVAQTKPDFIAKVAISRKEARETNYWLRLIVAADLMPTAEIEWELNESIELGSILAAIVYRARLSPRRGVGPS